MELIIFIFVCILIFCFFYNYKMNKKLEEVDKKLSDLKGENYDLLSY